jgi:hypothetical protein
VTFTPTDPAIAVAHLDGSNSVNER